MTTDVRPFALHVPDAALEDLRERLGRTRWPEAETVGRPGGSPDWSQGPPLALVRGLAAYWADTYDWRRVEAALNAHGQALTEVDGLDLHLLHVRSPRPDARPLVMTHGWPSSVLEPLAVMDALADPGDEALPAFHVVAPSLPGFGFGGRPASTGWDVDRTADAWVEVHGAARATTASTPRAATGADASPRRSASATPDRVAGLHSFTPYVVEPETTRRPHGRASSGGSRPVATSSGGRAAATPSSSRRGRRPSPTSSPTPRSPS